MCILHFTLVSVVTGGYYGVNYLVSILITIRTNHVEAYMLVWDLWFVLGVEWLLTINPRLPCTSLQCVCVCACVC